MGVNQQLSVRLAAGAAGLAMFVAVVAPSQAQNGAQNGAPIPTPAATDDNNQNRGRISSAGNGFDPVDNLKQAKGKGGPARPTPHYADGRVNFGPLPGESGVWEGNAGATLATNPPGGLDNPRMYLPTNMLVEEVPFRPWARAVYNYRQTETTKDDPHVRCKASGGPRMFHTPYGTEFIEARDEQKIYILGVGGPHTFRTIFMDGREHPSDLDATFSGHSVGHWEGETLVIDTVGFNEKFWLTREGIPHTAELHTIERFTRTDYNTMRYEVTIDDPGAYTEPWTGGWLLAWQDGEELYEYVCQENNRDIEHMFGGPRN